MNASVTNQIMPKDSLETLTTFSKFKYFVHIMYSSDSMRKRFDIRADKGTTTTTNSNNKLVF